MRREVELIEVRCCCSPLKLLGWLPLPQSADGVPGETVTFRVQPAHYERIGALLLDPENADEVLALQRVPAVHVRMEIREFLTDKPGIEAIGVALRADGVD